jgi:hypothetical protein
VVKNVFEATDMNAIMKSVVRELAVGIPEDGATIT